MWSWVMGALVAAATVVWVIGRILSIIYAVKWVPQIVRDVRGNRLVGLGWFFILASSVLLWPAWNDLHSTPLKGLTVLMLVLGLFLGTVLPVIHEARRR